MKILHVSVSLSRSAGGIFEIELALAHSLSALGIVNEAYGLSDEAWQSDKGRWGPIKAEVCTPTGPAAFSYSPNLLQKLLEADGDCAHLHYMWMYPSVAVSRWAKIKKSPYVVTPNGMLEPWALSNSAWKKKLAAIAYEDRMLQGAACIHANTSKELSDIRAYGLRNPVAVIPNGVDLPKSREEVYSAEDDRRTLLFLGRLHPKKGLRGLLRAWAGLDAKSKSVGRLVIAGWAQGGHETKLKELATELEIRWVDVRDQQEEFLHSSSQFSDFQLFFHGPAFGARKDALLREADAFILPSFSEGLPMAVLEAWAYGLPVLMTEHCNLPLGFAHQAALEIGTDTKSILNGLQQLFDLTRDDLRCIGQKGRKLVEAQFTWTEVAAQMKVVYEWLLGGGPAPPCVES